MPRIGNPPLYTRLLTSVMIKKRQEEFLHMPPLDLRVVKRRCDNYWKTKGPFFSVTHTIRHGCHNRDSVGLDRTHWRPQA